MEVTYRILLSFGNVVCCQNASEARVSTMRRAPPTISRAPLRLGAAPRLKRRAPFRLGAAPLCRENTEMGSSLVSRIFEYFRYIFSILPEYYSVSLYILVYLHAITLFPLNGISVLVCLLISHIFLYFCVFLCEITFLPLHA